MTEQELNALVAELAALEHDATPAPWMRSDVHGEIDGPDDTAVADEVYGGDKMIADAELIVKVRNTLPALLSALQAARMERAEASARAGRLQERVARLTEKVQAWCPHLSTSGYITGDECCDECGLVDPHGEAGDR